MITNSIPPVKISDISNCVLMNIKSLIIIKVHIIGFILLLVSTSSIFVETIEIIISIVETALHYSMYVNLKKKGVTRFLCHHHSIPFLLWGDWSRLYIFIALTTQSRDLARDWSNCPHNCYIIVAVISENKIFLEHPVPVPVSVPSSFALLSLVPWDNKIENLQV